jgi:hypothetical protein
LTDGCSFGVTVEQAAERASRALSAFRERLEAGVVCKKHPALAAGQREKLIVREFRLVPKVSAALWECSPRRDSVSLGRRRPRTRFHALPPATETEFRRTRPFPKRSANFGNEGDSASRLGEKWPAGMPVGHSQAGSLRPYGAVPRFRARRAARKRWRRL